ncbi:MAG TPA: protein kinase [Pyrinomonadaceae bacterium]|nr:protein kinase [Pyrinomonadaceae bacterium]
MKKCPKCGTEYPDDITLCPADGLALETTDDTLIGQTLAGKYRIDARLSEGGMGKVYRGTHILIGKTVAVKVLRPALAADEKIVARFSREARAASRISHPHALSVTDFGEDEEGRVFLVMEYLQGKTLKEIIREEGPMGLQRVVEITRQVGGALEAAHDQGVVHRDLKSENIMLLTTNGADYARVLDFGIAKIMEPEGGYDAEITAPNLVIGTPQYMSPEQCSQSTAIDSRSDIYSLGIILYEMLVGHVPFTGESSTAIMLKQMQEPAPSVLEERPDLPPAVAQVLARALAKDPDKRYQRAAEVIEDLTIASGGSAPGVADSGSTAVKSQESGRPASAEDLPDEETLVRPRVEQVIERAPITVRTQPPAGTAFNPWKVLIGSVAALLVIFAVIYAFTRNTQPAAQPQQGSTLVADPNSQPVEPVQPATGRSEAAIPAGGAIANPQANTGADTGANANLEASPSPSASASPNENANSSENKNANANSNRKAPPLPTPSRPVNVNEPPPPPPTPTGTKTPEADPTESLTEIPWAVSVSQSE